MRIKFSIYKMVGIMDIYKYLNTSIGTVMKNLEVLKLVPDQLKTKKSVSIQLDNYLIY